MTPASAPDVRDTRAVPTPTEPSIAAVAEVCERAAMGDLEARVIGLVDHPEFGRLARAINAMLDGADSFVREAAAAMENCSHDLFHRPILLRGLKGGYRQSAAVINAAGVKMRDNREGLTFVGGLAAENTENVKAVADAVAQLSETSNQIAREASEAARATQQTVAEAARASEAVGAMTAAVGAIDGMVTLISKVAGQTNLLALNATIEAARAGEAGKGFAVVASEVKELSRDTAKATGDISAQVEKIRHLRWKNYFVVKSTPATTTRREVEQERHLRSQPLELPLTRRVHLGALEQLAQRRVAAVLRQPRLELVRHALTCRSRATKASMCFRAAYSRAYAVWSGTPTASATSCIEVCSSSKRTNTARLSSSSSLSATSNRARACRSAICRAAVSPLWLRSGAFSSVVSRFTYALRRQSEATRRQMPYSQVSSDERPSNSGSRRCTTTKTSWAASSTSSSRTPSRRIVRHTIGAFVR